MANSELIKSISALSKRVDTLLTMMTRMQEKIATLEVENADLRKQHDEDVLKLENALKDIEFLSLSHRLAASPEALIEARNVISKLIRTIDSCIRMINDD